MIKQFRGRLLSGVILMSILPIVPGWGNSTSSTHIQPLYAKVSSPTSHTQVFFQSTHQPKVALTLHPDPTVMKAMPNLNPPNEMVIVYLPVYPGAKPVAPVSNIGDMGTPMDADLVDGSLYYASNDSAQQIQSWYTEQFQKLGYQVNGWGQSSDHGKTITSYVDFSKIGMSGDPTQSPNIGLGFQTVKQSGQTIFKLKVTYIVTPTRPKISYIPTNISKFVLINGSKSKTITNSAWISQVIRQINQLQMTTPGITSVPAVANGVNETVTAKFYANNGSVMDVEFLLPTSVVRIAKVTLNDSIILEQEIQAIFNESSSSSENQSQQQSSTTVNPQPIWTPIHNVVLAKSTVPGKSGDQLELIDISGKYAKNPIVGPFQGNNWTGQFQLRLVNSTRKVVSKLNLPSDPKLPENVYGIFSRQFQFNFADYNGDGYPDFALGQYHDGNGFIYQLFTVEPSGIKRLPTHPSWIYSDDMSYSPLFKKVKSNAFQITYFDNAITKWTQVTYTWEDGKFVMTGDSVDHKL
jgi:hypothetical protein